jgi:hypothetical protein
MGGIGGALAPGLSRKQNSEVGSGNRAASAACLIGGESFSAGTKVLTASGALVAISKLKTGQKVLAADTKTGKDPGRAGRCGTGPPRHGPV